MDFGLLISLPVFVWFVSGILAFLFTPRVEMNETLGWRLKMSLGALPLFLVFAVHLFVKMIVHDWRHKGVR